MNNLTVEPIELMLYPYSREYFELYRESRMCELKKFEKRIPYVENGVVYQPYTEDVVDSIGNFIAKIIQFFKRIGDGIVSAYRRIVAKINSGDEKTKEVDQSLRDICRKGHVWKKEEVEKIISLIHGGDVKYWSKINLSTIDPDVQKLIFDPSCPKPHQLALRNVFNVILLKDTNATIPISALEEAYAASSTQGNGGNGQTQQAEGNPLQKLWKNMWSSKKLMTISGAAIVGGGALVIGTPFITIMARSILNDVRAGEVEKLKKMNDDLQADKEAKEAELISKQSALGDSSKTADEINALQQECNDLIREIGHMKSEQLSNTRKYQKLEQAIKKFPWVRTLLLMVLGGLAGWLGYWLSGFLKFAALFDVAGNACKMISSTSQTIVG